MKHFGPFGRHEKAHVNYLTHGISILELARKAYRLCLKQKPTQKRKLLKILLLNSTFDSEKLYPTYNRPFDLLVKSNKNNDWLRGGNATKLEPFLKMSKRIQIFQSMIFLFREHKPRSNLSNC